MNQLKVLAHQFRTPLQTIGGMLHLLLDENIDNTVKKRLAVIQECNDHLTSIVDQIINVSLDYTKDQDHFTDFYLNNLIKKCVYANVDNPNKNSIVITSKIDKNLKLFGNDSKLKDLIHLILNSACTYTYNGLIEIISEVVTIQKDTVFLRLSLVDAKKGLNQEKKDTIYQSKLFNVTKDDAYLNFDLIILRKIISSLDGKLITDINTNFDTLIIEIPFKLSKKGLPSVVKNIKVTKRTKKNILIVEDSKINQLLIQKQLQLAGFMCDIADNGKEAVFKCNIKMYDIILMDLMMPIMDGFEASSIIKNKFKDIKIIAISAIADITDLKNKAFDSFLMKPLKKATLINEINEIN